MEQETNKPPLWVWFVAGAIRYFFDNLLFVSALVAACFDRPVIAAGFLLAALYERLTEIRDVIAEKKPPVNLYYYNGEPIDVELLKGIEK